MQCYVCGSFFDDNQAYCPVCGAMMQAPDPVYYEGMPPLEVQPPIPAPAPAAGAKRRKPHIALRIGMQLLSFLLSLVLTVALVATVVIADLNVLTSSGGIKQIITTLLMPSKAPARPHVMVGAGGVTINPDELGNLGELDNMDDILASTGDTNALVDILYSTMQDMMGEDVPISKEQIYTFVENSTVTDYISDKAAGYAEDILNGTENTQITTDELVQLLEDNKTVIEETFEITITEEQMEEIKTNVIAVVEEQDINNTIRTEINNAVNSATGGMESSGIPLSQIMAGLRLITQKNVLYGAIGACVLLILLLCALNFYNIPGGMTWASLPCILMGLILSAPIAALQMMPELLGEMAGFAPLVNVLAPVHYTVPITGFVLLFGSIIWRIVRACIRKNA